MTVLSDKIGKEIADALGLKRVKKMEIHLEARKLAFIGVEFCPDIDGLKAIETIIKKYTFEEIKEGETV
jgi:hypothetical protein